MPWWRIWRPDLQGTAVKELIVFGGPNGAGKTPMAASGEGRNLSPAAKRALSGLSANEVAQVIKDLSNVSSD
jgi:predicted ABC-type ATPase